MHVAVQGTTCLIHVPVQGTTCLMYGAADARLMLRPVSAGTLQHLGRLRCIIRCHGDGSQLLHLGLHLFTCTIWSSSKADVMVQL
jgi:hypothetical protein